MRPTKKYLQKFQRLILNYYRADGRDLPWRRTRDPYCILVSEIMLQQTHVRRVLVKYPAFIKKFPDFQTLARAPLRRILSVWQGMGYNRRALALKNIALIVQKQYNGKLPRDAAELIRLPGIGKTTAGSLCAFAFNVPAVFIETNIRRVFLHYFFPRRKNVRDDEIFPLVAKTVFAQNPRVWYWALMDYGSLLAIQTTNPNRRSSAYKKQSSFQGSNRQLRGNVITLLLRQKRMTAIEIAQKTNQPRERINILLKQLLREKIIAREKMSFRLA